MNFRLPVIAFDNGGVSEVVTDGYNGILLPEKDIVGLADAIKKVLADSEFRDKLVETAFDDVHSRFSVDTIVKQQIEIYNKILEHV